MTKTEQVRLTNWRFKVLQRAADARCVARTCRHFGLSRKTFYKWRRRFDEHGAAGLCDRPGRPHHSPRATPREVVSKILYLRENYHFGAGRIAAYLKRFQLSDTERHSITAFNYGISSVAVGSTLLSSGLAGETPRKRDAIIKSRILDSLNSFVLATSRRTYRQGRAFRVVSHLWAMATVRPLRLIGVLLVLYAMVGSNVFSPAEVPADAVRVLFWLFFSGVVALIVDEVCERIRREAREVMDRKTRER